jgi:hypothetical protein
MNTKSHKKGFISPIYSWCVRDLCSHKGSPTPLNAFKEGEKKEIVAALLLFPLLKNPPPSHPFRLLHLLLVGRPQNRSGIRNSLTRSDLVLGRRLVNHFSILGFFLMLVSLPHAHAVDANGYDSQQWGDEPANGYTITPNLEKTAPQETDPYFGPPGHQKNRPAPLQPVENSLKGKLFGKRQDPPPKVPDSFIINVGPRDYPASKEPLLRLDVALVTDAGATLYPGLYLVHTHGLQVAKDGSIQSAPTHMSLSYKGTLCLTLPLQAVSNTRKSPIEQLPSVSDAQAPQALQAPFRRAWILEESPDTVRLMYQVGELIFSTPPISKQ